jgi:hypothetical protein
MRRAAKRYLFTFSAALVAPLFVSIALADSPSPPLQLEYEVTGACPRDAFFEGRVRARTPLARFSDDRNARPVHVVVKAAQAGFSGHLAIVGDSGHIRERDVAGPDCADVVDALALVTALVVDPHAVLSPIMPSVPAPDEAAAPLPLPEPATAPPPVPAWPPLPVLTPPSATPELAEPPPSQGPRWRLDVGGVFVTIAGLAPDALAGGGAYGELASTSTEGLAPSARLTIYAAENGVYGSRTASFLLVAARADVCPWHIGSNELSLRPCAAVDLGTVQAEGIRAVPGGRGVQGGEAWFDLAALLRARWAPHDGRFFLEAEAGAFVPVTRASFVYTNDPTAVDTPAWVGALGSLTAGLRLR